MSYSTQDKDAYTLRISSPAAAGLVAAVSNWLASRGAYIVELQQYDDPETKRFFMRCVYKLGIEDADIFDQNWLTIAAAHSLEWTVRRSAKAQRVLILVSKSDHCLRDLLYRKERGELTMDVVGIVSNHGALEPIASRYAIPFFHIPVVPQEKQAAEQALRKVISDQAADLVVLARYMQILSNDFSKELFGRCINIHHSFLPSFKGGSPYAQAHARGVKLIGATAHYVTADLDEGPIIEQAVQRIDHRYEVSEMQGLGRDVEAAVLARAVRLHLEDRIFITGNKTVVFS